MFCCDPCKQAARGALSLAVRTSLATASTAASSAGSRGAGAGPRFVLVDRMSVRRKAEKAMPTAAAAGEAAGKAVAEDVAAAAELSVSERLTIDIRHLRLSRVQAVSGAAADPDADAAADDAAAATARARAARGQRPAAGADGAASAAPGRGRDVVGFSKHLCGVATDLSLRCLHNLKRDEVADAGGGALSGVAIALCCHALCEFDDYVGHSLMQEVFAAAASAIVAAGGAADVDEGHDAEAGGEGGELEFDYGFCSYGREQFDELRCASGWATTYAAEPSAGGGGGGGGSKKGQGAGAGTTTGSGKHRADRPGAQTSSGRRARAALSVAEREARAAVGRRCKQLLDSGRLRFLREELGLEGALVEYCDEALTPENVLLLGWRPLGF